jgi:hypothetical protein
LHFQKNEKVIKRRKDRERGEERKEMDRQNAIIISLSRKIQCIKIRARESQDNFRAMLKVEKKVSTQSEGIVVVFGRDLCVRCAL